MVPNDVVLRSGRTIGGGDWRLKGAIPWVVQRKGRWSSKSSFIWCTSLAHGRPNLGVAGHGRKEGRWQPATVVRG